MEKLKEEIKKLNKDSKFVELMSEEEEERKYINTVKKIEYNKGVEQGILKTARNLLDLGIPVEDIVKATGLTEKDIEKINN